MEILRRSSAGRSARPRRADLQPEPARGGRLARHPPPAARRGPLGRLHHPQARRGAGGLRRGRGAARRSRGPARGRWPAPAARPGPLMVGRRAHAPRGESRRPRAASASWSPTWPLAIRGCRAAAWRELLGPVRRDLGIAGGRRQRPGRAGRTDRRAGPAAAGLRVDRRGRRDPRHRCGAPAAGLAHIPADRSTTGSSGP